MFNKLQQMYIYSKFTFQPLLTMTKYQEKAMLSVSSLVHSLCRNNPDCENYMEVRKIISLMENKIAPACKVTPKTMQTVSN